ncbi:cardiolipin synthase [Methylobacterium sp. W2]|uniref:cardiolipin synthase n=1 Tax=Methylobacterium sp. W2 TaxID=2598107 RepID=UPI001D0C563D|nr:cardiolipin synthase [Methylobacterium sp. W2]MCC0808917.1 cardiolipin synthase [Methylobacterium sp. W2]
MEDLLHRWLQATGSIRADVLALLGIVLALLVTVHALLRKREIGTAIGWIGLAWLSPIFGTALYAIFGVNRVSRRARQLRVRPSQQAGSPVIPDASVPEDLRPLDRAVRRITRLVLLGGNDFSILRNGDEAYPAMLDAIGGATRSVALSSYIFRNDGAGSRFFEALVTARSRGVEVRVLIDGIGSGYFFPAMARRLRRAGVPVGLFMHSALPWRMPFLNLRTHKKILIVDGRIAFTGGINIADENLVATSPPDPVRDTHFRIEGPVVEQLSQAFSADWAFVMGEELDGPRWFPPLGAAGEIEARVVTSGPDADIEKIEFAVMSAITCAQHSIRLVTPYFLPSEILSTTLALAATRGVRVDVIIPRASNHSYVDWATRAHVAPLLEAGVRIWLDEPPFDHSKLLVVDGEWSFVGSANWDMRSFRLNFELNVEVYDRAFAERLDAFMRTKMDARLTVEELARRPLPVRLRDAAVRLMLPYL